MGPFTNLSDVRVIGLVLMIALGIGLLAYLGYLDSLF